MKRILPVILFALVISAGASYFIFQLLSSRFASAQKAQTNRVWVAARELGTGVMIKDPDIREIEWTGPWSMIGHTPFPPDSREQDAIVLELLSATA